MGDVGTFPIVTIWWLGERVDLSDATQSLCINNLIEELNFLIYVMDTLVFFFFQCFLLGLINDHR